MSPGVLESFARQRDACADAGSPFYATLLAGCIADIEADGPVADVVQDVDDSNVPPLLPLRFLGGVHRLVLERQAPRLALHYASVGGDGDASTCWPAFRACVEQNVDRLRDDLQSAPQTNDVGRSALLIGALHHLSARYGLPVRLFEIGSSAGLNLLADSFAVTDRDGRLLAGPRDAAVVLRDAWRGELPPSGEIQIVERTGCDLAPVDVATVQGRTRLTSFVWPDDRGRLERLRSALSVATTTPVEVQQRDAVEFVEALRLQPATVTVLWHSVVTMYMDRPTKAALRLAIGRLHASATDESVFAHVWFEPRATDHVRFGLRMQVGHEPDAQVVAEAPPHGMPAVWL